MYLLQHVRMVIPSKQSHYKPKYKNNMKVEKKQPITGFTEESFEIFCNKNNVKLPRNKKYASKLNSKMCPITIIQAPITVNGDNAVKVHQSIVLSSNKNKQTVINKLPGSHKQSVDHKQVELNFKNMKGPSDFDIFVNKANKGSNSRGSNSNPYSKKLSAKNKHSLRVSTQQSNYSNNEMSHLLPGYQYSISSSFNKRKSTDLRRPNQKQNFTITDKSKKVSKIRMKKYRKASDSAHKRL